MPRTVVQNGTCALPIPKLKQPLNTVDLFWGEGFFVADPESKTGEIPKLSLVFFHVFFSDRSGSFVFQFKFYFLAVS